jgi:tight adherence protein C
MTLTPALAGLMACGFVVLGLLAVPMLRDRGPAGRFLEDTGGGARGPLLPGLVDRLARALAPRAVRALNERRRASVERRLDLAGRPSNMTVARFAGLRAAIFTLAVGLGLLLVALGSTPILLVLLAVIGWFGLDVWLSRTGRLRQERIEADLPDFLDILAVTVRAGLGYRSALQRVAESLGGPIGDEMTIALRQMDLGAKRRDAFLALRDRNASEQLRSFVTAQLQAEELGVPLSEAINDIAGDMRRAAHQAARKRAQQAAPRVSLLVTTLIVPGAIILIMVSLLLGSNALDSGIL